MGKKDLDLKDRKILYQLDLDSRQSNSTIAKKVRLSKDVVNYRIKKLEQEGYIKGYYTVIDFSKLGYFSVRAYLKLFDATPAKEKDIIEFLVKHNKTFFVGETEGYLNIAVGTWVKDIYDFEEFYREFKKKFKQYISEEQISIFTRAHHYHRAYLLGKKFDDAVPEVFGRSKKEKCDDLDIGILKLLASHARMTTAEIGGKLKTPVRTIAFRIKQLEKRKIIQGYRFIFDFELHNYKYYKIDLTLKSVDRLKELLNYAHAHPNILYADETIGGSDFEFDIEVKNIEEFRKVVRDFRDRFPEIRSWKYFSMKKYNKLLYYPEA